MYFTFTEFRFFYTPHVKLTLSLILIVISASLVLFSGCDEKASPKQPDPLKIEVDKETQLQIIAGFGGANRMWGTQFLKPTEAQKAFGNGPDELGLSIFRVRIASNTAEWSLILESVKEAQKFGVKIQASPWSPPAALKSNGSDIGGRLLPENYDAFKDHINAFITMMASNGVDIYAVSVQNEPDIQVSYESCDWSSGEMSAFIRDFGDQIEGAKLAAPESFNFNFSYTNDLLFNTGVAENLDIVAGHIYGGGLSDFPQAEQKGKEIWMTEYLLNLDYSKAGDWSSSSESVKWDETLQMLQTVHGSMTHNWNAYVWWYLQRFYSFIGDGEEGTVSGEVLKRGYAFSHYAKYIRPGYHRMGVNVSKSNDLLITAYAGENKLVFVIINPTDKAVLNLNVAVPDALSVTSYTSSISVTMEKKQAEIDSNVNAVISAPAKSVVTVVADI